MFSASSSSPNPLVVSFGTKRPCSSRRPRGDDNSDDSCTRNNAHNCRKIVLSCLVTADGWFKTGDVVRIDAHGCIKICDRSKDLVKSGGEWISSVDLENLIMGHPKVLEACVVGLPHPKWDERPWAFVVAKSDYSGQVTPDEILEYLRPHVAKWWLPDGIEFVEAIPKTSVGKFDKKVLRSKYATHIGV